MSTIGSLLALMDPQIKPWSEGMESVNRAEFGRQRNETGLLDLAELRRQQEEAAATRAFLQQHPEFVLGGPPQSTIASLAPGGPPGGGPMTQQPFGPGGGGPTQTVPAYPDASRFAGVSPQGGGPLPPDVMGQTMPTVTPPTSTLASLGPQPQAPNPQQRLLALARTNPEAALKVQQLMQGQQDQQWKLEERRLDMGFKVAQGVARELQGVTNQETLDAARERVRHYHPQAAAQIPQFYSKEGVESIQQRGIAVADRAQNAYHEAKARNLDMETRMFPELAQRFGMGGEAQAPAGDGVSQWPAGTTAGTPAPRTAPPEYESAITEANRLYPQVPVTRIKSIIAAESNFDARAVSPAGAKGPMQLMDPTAKDMGVDDPFNVQQNVRGGTRYYAQLLTKYGGDERKALAAYNWGPGNLDNVGGDVSKAPAETQAYVQRVMGGGGATTGTAQAPTADPRIAQLDREIARRTQEAKIAALMKNESLSTRLNDDANRLKDERTRLLEDSRRQQERSEEIPRAVDKERQLTQTKQDLERQRQAGPMLPKERREAFGGLRGDILKEPTHKIYQDVRNGYQNVKIGAASDSAQGDLAIFNGLAKILDPTSSVLSGEARNIEEAQGQLQIWFNSPAKFLEGDRISKENRPRFLKMAYDLAKEKLTTAQSELKTVWGPIAKESNIDFDQLVPLPDLQPLEPGPNVSKLDKLINK